MKKKIYKYLIIMFIFSIVLFNINSCVLADTKSDNTLKALNLTLAVLNKSMTDEELNQKANDIVAIKNQYASFLDTDMQSFITNIEKTINDMWMKQEYTEDGYNALKQSVNDKIAALTPASSSTSGAVNSSTFHQAQDAQNTTSSSTTSASNTSTTSDTSGDFWKQAGAWFSAGQDEKIPVQAQAVISNFSNMINVVGTSVIVLATIFLGIKYMVASANGKSQVKESLITLLVACIFFFGWQAIANLLFPGNNFIFTSASSGGNSTFNQMVAKIFSTVVYIAQFCAAGAAIYIGVRYIFAGATGKSELKAKSGQFLIGIILTFAATSLLAFISKIINAII